MKKKYLRIFAMALVAVMSILCIPGTFAKYSKEETYTVAVKQKEIKIEPGKIVYSTNNSSGEKQYTADKDGYYAVLIKGGNGGSGIVGDGSKASGWKTNSSSVGKGGIMLGIVHMSEEDFLAFTVGQNGTDASINSSLTGNIRSTSIGNGGTTTETYVEWTRIPFTLIYYPSYYTKTVGYLKGADGSKSGLSNYAYAAGGGGGSSTVVYLNESTPEALLMIAGGGGGSSGADTDANGSNGNTSTWSYGFGGDGGSNINPSTNSIGGNVGIGSVTGCVYNGFDGNSSKGNTNAIGYGGTTNPGAGATGYSSTSNCEGATGTLLSIDGGSFKNTTGCGGAAGGIGGGGGGGYAGGGGGGCGWFKSSSRTNTDAIDSPGGGGGGSSFAKSNIDSSGMTTENRQALANDMMKAVSYSSSTANGWVIVKQLSTSDIMTYGITVS